MNYACHIPPPVRNDTSRLFRLWCWLWYGHDKDMPGKTAATCDRCGAVILGGD